MRPCLTPITSATSPSWVGFIDDNVEFYHDQGGVTLGRAALVDSVKNNICGKVTRELVPSSLQVYPMKGYGAIEMGTHLFHHPGHPENGDGEREVRSPLAVQRWCLEGHARVELRPSCRGEVELTTVQGRTAIARRVSFESAVEEFALCRH